MIGRFGIGLMLINVFFWSSCSQKTTASQREKFEQCRANLKGYSDRIKELKLDQKIPDSIYQLMKDAETMSLDNIIDKYHIQKGEIDAFILSICVGSEIQNSFNKLDKLQEIDASEFNSKIDKIKPFNFKKSQYINFKNDTLYIDENGDTIKIAKYE